MTTAVPPSSPARCWRRRAIALAGMLLAIPAVAWLAFPLWAGYALPYFLPSGWKLLALETGRPGLSALPVKQVRLEGALPGFKLEASASNVDLRLDGSWVGIRHLSLELSPSVGVTPDAARPDASEADLAEHFSLPRLVPPGGLPRIEIGRLEWNLAAGSEVQSGLLEDLAFGEDAATIRLQTRLDPIPFMDTPGLLTTQLSEDAVNLDLLTEGPETRRVFFYRQVSHNRPDGDGRSEAEATLQFDFDLAEFDHDALNALGARRGLPHLDHASGALRAGMQFRGRERLYPVAFTMQADALDLRGEGSSLALGWAASGGLEGAFLQLNQDYLHLNATLADAGLLSRLQTKLQDSGLTGFTGEVAQGSLDATSAWTGRLNLAAGRLDKANAAFEGAASLGGTNVRFKIEKALMENEITRMQGRLDLEHGEEILFEPPDLRLAMNHLRCELEATVSLGPDGRVEASGQLTDGRTGLLTLFADGQLLMGHDFTLSGAFTLGEDSTFTGPFSARKFRAEETGADAPMLVAESLSGALETRWTVTAAATTGELRFDGVRLPAMDLAMDALDVRIESLSLPDLDGRLSILTTGMAIPLFEKRTPGFDLDLATAVAGGGATEGAGELLIGYDAALPFRFRFEPGTNDLVIGLERAELSATALPRLARTIEPAWAELLKPAGGQIVLDGSITWKDGAPAPTGTVSVDSDDLDFCIGETCISDFDLHGQWTLGDALDGATSISAGLVGLAAGLDMSGFQAQLAVTDGERITLDGLSAVILDGRLEATTIGIDKQQMDNTTVHWAGADLGRLFRFLDVGGLDGAGRIDAHLPIAGQDGAYAITDGTFQSTGPGRIRYTTGVPATNIGMQALENFAFDSLGGTVNYQASGRYDIQVRLEGRNPDLYGGHPIRFNLNLGGELPALFRALFITGNFGQAILDRVRSGELKEGVN